MGGIARLIRKLPMVKAIAPKVAAPQPAPVAATATKAPAVAAAKKSTFGGGMGNQTVLTSAQGIEDEANVAKTVLGGATTKKKNYGQI